MNNYLRGTVNGFTHLAGAILFIYRITCISNKNSFTRSFYYSFNSSNNFRNKHDSFICCFCYLSLSRSLVIRLLVLLRRLDHAMIFLLIAGSYTPFCLIALKGVTGWVLFSIIITIAIVGISFKLIWFNCPRWLSTSIYVLME